MKLLHIGICVYDSPIWLARSLKKFCDYRECRPELPDDEILRLFNDFKPDIVFMQIQTADVVATATIAKMSESAKIINWTGDVRQPMPSWYIEIAPYVLNCFSNEFDVKRMRQMGHRAEFLQIGIDPLIFNNWQGCAGADVVFMANHYGRSFPVGDKRKGAANHLKMAFGRSFHLLGTGWGGKEDGNLNGNQLAESQFYSGSKIGINISHYELERYTSDRLFRIMASGCMCLSHRYPGIERDFEIGTHLDVFDDFNDLKRKVRRYLDNTPARRRIADHGYKLVHEKYSCDNMAQNILNLYEV